MGIRKVPKDGVEMSLHTDTVQGVLGLECRQGSSSMWATEDKRMSYFGSCITFRT